LDHRAHAVTPLDAIQEPGNRPRRAFQSKRLLAGMVFLAIFELVWLAWFCLRRDVPRSWNPPMARMDAELPVDARALLVGQAAVFDLDHIVVYNTVFNPETIEQLAKGKTAEEFRRALEERKVTHV
jgi:hypothetical protein